MLTKLSNMCIIRKTVDIMEDYGHIGRMTICTSQEIGRLGEIAAVRYLRRHGYKIIGRNLRSKIGELDILASIDATLVFVEVKARSGTWTGEAFEAVGPAKQKKLRNVVNGYLSYGGVGNMAKRFLNVRIDVIGVRITKGGAVVKIDHVQDAFS